MSKPPSERGSLSVTSSSRQQQQNNNSTTTPLLPPMMDSSASKRSSVIDGKRASTSSRQSVASSLPKSQKESPASIPPSLSGRSNRSITSSEAINKLRELESLLDRERTARVTAEKTLSTLREERKAREEAERARNATEKQMQMVLQSLQELIGQPVDVAQLERFKKQVLNREQQQRLQQHITPRSFLDAIGEGEEENDRTNHIRSAKRTATTVDHKGLMHFRVPGQTRVTSVEIRSNNRKSLPSSTAGVPEPSK